jgi:hypothetical protein
LADAGSCPRPHPPSAERIRLWEVRQLGKPNSNSHEDLLGISDEGKKKAFAPMNYEALT